MAVRKDITVTTKHSYEIAYKYQWRCSSAACAKVYGRHSKSIDPLKHACGVCGGTLLQLDKNGEPVNTGKRGEGLKADGTPRKESEWSAFSKVRACSIFADPGSSFQARQSARADSLGPSAPLPGRFQEDKGYAAGFADDADQQACR